MSSIVPPGGRMDKHGYIKELERHASELGADVVQVCKIEAAMNPLNPTACFVIRPSGPEIASAQNRPTQCRGPVFRWKPMPIFYSRCHWSSVSSIKRRPILRKNTYLASSLFK